MSAAAAPVSLAEYMSTEYEPDCDFVDGFLVTSGRLAGTE